LLWEALCRGFGVRPILLPPPSTILAAMVTRGDLLLANLWPSVYQTVLLSCCRSSVAYCWGF
jgi:ABC-type nitrate/sulfonate/bicarbonate transport system permease component